MDVCLGRWRARATCAALALSFAFAAPASGTVNSPLTEQAVVQPAADGVFEAFESHPLVGLSDHHGFAQAMAFYATLVRDPRFARDVGNVVVEFGAGGRQDIIDRYLAGETVPYVELRTVWSDTVGWVPTAGYLGFAEFFAAVRETNAALPPNRRIRVWLGEPPIDWSSATRAQIMTAMNARDTRPAGIIVENILASGKKALVIYGGVHFSNGASSLRGR